MFEFIVNHKLVYCLNIKWLILNHEIAEIVELKLELSSTSVNQALTHTWGICDMSAI